MVEVDVIARDMQFIPNKIEVQPGDKVIINLTNEDPTNVHDLQIGMARSNRLAQGESAQLDLGMVTHTLNGWCTIAGHKQMGMLFDVVVAGSDPAMASGGPVPLVIIPAIPWIPE